MKSSSLAGIGLRWAITLDIGSTLKSSDHYDKKFFEQEVLGQYLNVFRNRQRWIEVELPDVHCRMVRVVGLSAAFKGTTVLCRAILRYFTHFLPERRCCRVCGP